MLLRLAVVVGACCITVMAETDQEREKRCNKKGWYSCNVHDPCEPSLCEEGVTSYPAKKPNAYIQCTDTGCERVRCEEGKTWEEDGEQCAGDGAGSAGPENFVCRTENNVRGQNCCMLQDGDEFLITDHEKYCMVGDRNSQIHVQAHDIQLEDTGSVDMKAFFSTFSQTFSMSDYYITPSMMDHQSTIYNHTLPHATDLIISSRGVVNDAAWIRVTRIPV